MNLKLIDVNDALRKHLVMRRINTVVLGNKNKIPSPILLSDPKAIVGNSKSGLCFPVISSIQLSINVNFL